MPGPGTGHAAASPADGAWRLHAACRGVASELFFGPDGERHATKLAREGRAKEIRAVCPVVEPCRQFVLAQRESFGVWGGLGERERAELRLGIARTT
jgi:WhiB family transcriptional regulator, redox-sensing transcriptional regulator